MRLTGGKSLDADANAHARGVLWGLVYRDFGGSSTAAAKALGVSQSYLHGFMKGSRGAGLRLVLAVARHLGWSLERVLGQAPAPPKMELEVGWVDVHLIKPHTMIRVMFGQGEEPVVRVFPLDARGGITGIDKATRKVLRRVLCGTSEE